MPKKQSAQEKLENINLAEKLIREWLANGEIPLSIIRDRFSALGIPEKDVQKARKSLRVRTKLKGGEGYWSFREPPLNPNQTYRWWRG